MADAKIRAELSAPFVLYQSEDGQTRLQCRREEETLWLTQAQMAELFQTTPQNVTLHLKAIYAEGGQLEEATCKKSLQVRSEGDRSVPRDVRHDGLEANFAVGRPGAHHWGLNFCQWATERLRLKCWGS